MVHIDHVVYIEIKRERERERINMSHSKVIDRAIGLFSALCYTCSVHWIVKIIPCRKLRDALHHVQRISDEKYASTIVRLSILIPY